MIALLDVGTRIDIGILQFDSELTHNRIEVHVDALKELDVCIELGGK
jgi:hypothetical protein